MKILVVRFSSIGDVVLTTPVIHAISTQLPETEIHYITKKTFASLVQENKCIQKLYTIEKSIDEVLPALKAEKYDYIIDLHKNLRTFQLKQKLAVKSFSFDKLNIQKWLLVNFKYKNMPNIHIVDRYFEAVKPLGVINSQTNCELPFSEKHVVDTLQTLTIAPKSYLSVAMGAQFATKTMPIDLMYKILNPIQEPIVLLGGPTDVQRAAELEEKLQKNGNKVINTTSQFSLLQSASIVAQSKVILAHDTGLMHIATAFNVPIVSVWGNTVPELGMYPYYPTQPELYSIHEVKDLSCRPCSKIGYKSCPKKHFNCMQFQNSAAITLDLQHRLRN